MRRAKVLHLITHLGVGGATDNTLLTVQGLSRERYEVHLGAGVLLPDEEYTDWTPRGREAADDFFTIPDLVRPIRPWGDLRSLLRLTGLMKERRYDIVHTHCAKAGIVGRIAARRAKVPIVVHTFHSFSWKVTGDPGASLRRRSIETLKRRGFVALERYTAKISDALITVADLNKREALEVGLAPAERITTVCSGIDVDRFASAADRATACRELGLDPARPIVGTIGRLSTQKDPLTFVRAAREVLRRKPDVQFLLVGDGPLANDVRSAVEGDDRIRLMGYRDDVPLIVSVLDVFVLSSLWEGLGRALTEAMSVGIPVAATAVDGIPELVRDGETGRLCPPGDPEKLADNIVWMLDNASQARRMGALGRERVRPLYTQEKMVDGIDAVYRDLLSRKGLA